VFNPFVSFNFPHLQAAIAGNPTQYSGPRVDFTLSRPSQMRPSSFPHGQRHSFGFLGAVFTVTMLGAKETPPSDADS